MTITPAIVRIMTGSGTVEVTLERDFDGDPLSVVTDLVAGYESQDGYQWIYFNNERRALLLAEFLLKQDFDGNRVYFERHSARNAEFDRAYHIYTFEYRSIGLPEVTVQGPGSSFKFNSTINELTETLEKHS